MTATLIENVNVLRPGVACEPGSVLIEDGKITAIHPSPDALPGDVERVDGGGALLTPGLIDIHTHGMGHLIYEPEAQGLLDAGQVLARYGTTSILPTFVKVMRPDMLDSLAKLAKALDEVEGVSMPGFHLEGPFLKLSGAGTDTIAGDVGFLDAMLDACGEGKVIAMSISPDTPNIMPVIDRLCERNVAPFITHTRANAEQSLEAIERGARHGTHFYDVFPIPQESDPGVRPVGAIEALLADARCTVDFIADGVHVHPLAIRAALAAKGYQGIVLITDSNLGAGLEPGLYPIPTKYTVRVEPGNATRIHDPGHKNHGTLAGSSLTMDEGINNLRQWLDLPIEQIFAMGSLNAAQAVGLENKGDIRVGGDADLVLWDQADDGKYTVARTWSNGVCVYQQVMAH